MRKIDLVPPQNRARVRLDGHRVPRPLTVQTPPSDALWAEGPLLDYYVRALAAKNVEIGELRMALRTLEDKLARARRRRRR